MTVQLIPEPTLLTKEGEIRRRVGSLHQIHSVDVDDDFYGAAFRFYLLFTHWPFLLDDGERVTREQIVYNRFYWFQKFVRLHALRHGYDAGMEQQVFQLLESADCDLEWSVIQQIEERVRLELEGAKPFLTSSAVCEKGQ